MWGRRGRRGGKGGRGCCGKGWGRGPWNTPWWAGQDPTYNTPWMGRGYGMGYGRGRGWGLGMGRGWGMGRGYWWYTTYNNQWTQQNQKEDQEETISRKNEQSEIPQTNTQNNNASQYPSYPPQPWWGRPISTSNVNKPMTNTSYNVTDIKNIAAGMLHRAHIVEPYRGAPWFQIMSDGRVVGYLWDKVNLKDIVVGEPSYSGEYWSVPLIHKGKIVGYIYL